MHKIVILSIKSYVWLACKYWSLFATTWQATQRELCLRSFIKRKNNCKKGYQFPINGWL